MKPTQRFKRVADRPKKNPNEAGNDSMTRASPRLKSLTRRRIQYGKPTPEIQPIPVSRLSLHQMSIISPEFFQIDALDLAPRLLGKFLKKDDVVLQITEVVNAFFIFCLFLEIMQEDN